MKIGKISSMALMLTALVFLGIFSVLQASAKIVPTPYGWNSFNPVTFTETAGLTRVNEPMDVFFYPSFGNCSSPNEIRVIAPNNVTEVPSQVYNVTMQTGYVKSCNVVFPVNCTASSTVTYYIVYNNPGVSAPSYPTDLKLKTVPRGGVTEITARINNAKYSTYVGREGSIGGTETGKEVYIKDWKPSQNIFVYSGCAWIPWAKLDTGQPYWFFDYVGHMSLVRNGSVFIDLNAPAIWIGAARTTGGLDNFTSKLRFYAHNSWFTNTLASYTSGTKTYKWLKPSVATDQVYMALAVFPNMTGGRHISTKNVNTGSLNDYINFTAWDNTWVDYANSSLASNDHGFAILNLPGGTPWTGLGKTPGSGGQRNTGDSWTMYWTGSGAVFTANLVLGFHANSNYTYAQNLYDELTNSLQSTLEVLTENGAPTPSYSVPGWSYYTPINVSETIGKARTFEPVDVFFRPGTGKCDNPNEIRVYDSAGNEIPSQVYNTTFGGTPPNQYVASSNVVFLANVTANKENTYYIWYGSTTHTIPGWYKTWSDLGFSTQTLSYKPGYYTVDAANTYYNSTGEIMGSGAMSHVKVLGHSSTLDVMGAVFLPALRLPSMPYGEGYFGFWSLKGTSTIVRQGPVFADVFTNVSDFGLAQGFRKSGANYTIMLRYYAYTPWVTATITYKANGTVDYELMEIGVKVAASPDGKLITTGSTEGIPWLTRPNAAGVPGTFNMTLKPGNVTTDSKPKQTLSWCADWNKTWVDFQNKTASSNPVGCALINLDGAGTTSFKGLKSEGGDEGSPYWNGTCTTKTAKLAVGFHTGSNYTYAQNLYTRLAKNPLTVTVKSEVSLWAKFKLINLWTININLKQGLDTPGDRLIVEFYSYSGVSQGQSPTPIWTGTTPTITTVVANVTHPSSLPIENVTVVLYNGANRLSTVTSFKIHRTDLNTRIGQLDYLWGRPDANRSALMKEYVAIDGQWPYAPP